MTGRQMMMTWGSPHLHLLQHRAFFIDSNPRQRQPKIGETRRPHRGHLSCVISRAFGVSIYRWIEGEGSRAGDTFSEEKSAPMSADAYEAF